MYMCITVVGELWENSCLMILSCMFVFNTRSASAKPVEIGPACCKPCTCHTCKQPVKHAPISLNDESYGYVTSCQCCGHLASYLQHHAPWCHWMDESTSACMWCCLLHRVQWMECAVARMYACTCDMSHNSVWLPITHTSTCASCRSAIDTARMEPVTAGHAACLLSRTSVLWLFDLCCRCG
jgi:hypothetical protein